jgi:CO dehydrogenase maturation factor
MLTDDLPDTCITEKNGIKLLVIGKISSFGEGCACMIGGISKAVLSRLKEKKNEIVLIDAEAGLEHFGRRVDSTCDLILGIVDPCFESIHMAQRTVQLADEAGVQAYFVINKVEKELSEAVAAELVQEKVIASLPLDRKLFIQNLKGEPLDSSLPALEVVCSFIENFRKPLTLNVRM